LANETIITVIGYLTGDPELRFTQTGKAVASMTIASTQRMFDRQANEWKDGDTLFMRSSLWGEAAENAANSLVKGSRVIAQGRLIQRSYETRDGEKRSSIELQIDEIGASLRNATVQVQKNQKPQGQQAGGFGRQSTNRPPADDPWSANPPQNDPGEPPF